MNTSDSQTPWWKAGVIYQIYTRSFFDTNNDGIGDLRGVIRKLDYLNDLGIKAIWLTPVFETPNHDYGYDVRDYYEIDPSLGTLKDLKMLLHEAHQRGIKIILDMVLNHTSHLHSWFLESRSSTNNNKRDWYIWRDKVQGKAPNNWKNAFGGSAWEWDEKTEQYYLHTFLKEQPDLNWRNKEVREAFFSIFRYWLDLGVDGFRLDVINMIIKDKKMRDNPWAWKLPFFQELKYTANQQKSVKIVKQLREVLDEYQDRIMVGEVYTLPPGNAQAAAMYLGDGSDALQLAFDFSLLFSRWSARNYYLRIKHWMNLIPEQGWACHVLSNHDLHRNYNRTVFIENDKKARVAAMMLLTLRGTPFIYYGEEIGMENTPVPRKHILDPLGKRFWPLYSGRDQARRPMQWSDKHFAGFSDHQPWLPPDKNYTVKNVEAGQKDPESLLHLYRNLINLRNEHHILQTGKLKFFIKGVHNIMGYYREEAGQTYLILLNFSQHQRKVSLPSRTHWTTLLNTYRQLNTTIQTKQILLSPFEGLILKKIVD